MSKNIKFLGLLLTLIIIFIILLKGLNVSKDYSNEKLKSKIDFSLNAKKLFSDEIINISDLFDKNSPSVVNIWASWCAPCRVEHQFLMKLKDMNINIIGINYKDSSLHGAHQDAQIFTTEGLFLSNKSEILIISSENSFFALSEKSILLFNFSLE